MIVKDKDFVKKYCLRNSRDIDTSRPILFSDSLKELKDKIIEYNEYDFDYFPENEELTLDSKVELRGRSYIYYVYYGEFIEIKYNGAVQYVEPNFFDY